ncbi:MAG: type II toxin-antitoxin system VapB family antitoxin [Verrucomicrobiales bacterium]|nr:type II toxin-antitoxin system VapB family antitoxin [Verrucomicrobiales bacterium]
MKITLNMDDALLDRVMASTGAATKTEAILTALREVDRRSRLVEVLREGTGATREELKTMFDPASDALELRVAESRSGKTGKAAAKKISYRSKPGSKSK